MGEMNDTYADVGWGATAISLSLVRVEQDRPISGDRESLEAVVGALDNFAQGDYEQETEIPLFSRIEGLLVFVRTMSEWDQLPAGRDIRQRAGGLAEMLRGFLNGTGEGAGQGKLLRTFFRKVHDVAEEVTATGLPFDPVVEVFGALARSRRIAPNDAAQARVAELERLRQEVAAAVREIPDHVIVREDGAEEDVAKSLAVSAVKVRARVVELEERAEKAELALRKINDVRNSIVGAQHVNWSEHIYPLVAALDEAGVEGQAYPEALENFRTLIEQRDEAERNRDRFKERSTAAVAELMVVVRPFMCLSGTDVVEVTVGDVMFTRADVRRLVRFVSDPGAAIDRMLDVVRKAGAWVDGWDPEANKSFDLAVLRPYCEKMRRLALDLKGSVEARRGGTAEPVGEVK